MSLRGKMMFKQFLFKIIATSTVGLLALASGFALANSSSVQAAMQQAGLVARPAAAILSVNAEITAVTVPSVFNYQGIVRDADGKALASGNYNMTFKIYADLAGGTAAWTEAHTGVAVREGRFGVTLGTVTGIPADLFHSSANHFVGVTVESFAEMQPRLRLSSVPYAFQAEYASQAATADNAAFAQDAKDGVPVGAVIDWWRPDSSLSIPDGYLVCNGSTVNDTSSPLNGKVLPNLTDRFVRGVTNVGSIGTIGGSDTHAHSVAISEHTHSVTHDHPAVTSSGPSEAGGTDLANAGFWANWRHTHTVDLPSNTVTSAPGGAAAVNSSAANHLPPYIGLLKLCRVK